MTDLKIQEVTSAIANELRTSCKCQITDENFDNVHLVCSSESSNTVIYRTQIVATSEEDTTALALVSLLEEWIGTTPTINVLGALIRVGEECSVNVTDLSGGVCKERPTCSSTQAQSRSTNETCTDIGVTVGIAVAVGVGVVLAAGAIIVVVCCIMKRQRHKSFFPNTTKE